ncbi:MAG TPA: hypothetical protein DCG52_04150 [Alphaproteobacteria bacterium]|nr:hypothetical protein [Alphaproteobacteria bacterium]|tara:strand:+ start:711 stop:1640 length:930 start_codon:yes stop_codon:yes gene_type:complete
MENKEEKKTISDQPKIDKKRLGKVIIFLLFFGFLLIFISNYKYFSDSFQQFFSFQKEDTIEEAFEETVLDELSHLRKDFELIDRKIQDLDKDVNDRLSQVEQKVGNVSSQENFESIKNINSELLDIKDRLNRINLDNDNGNTLIFAIGQLEKRIMLSDPFEKELLVVRNLNDDENIEKIIKRLDPFSKKGVPTLRDLERTLALIAKKVILAEKDLKKLNVFEKIKYKISNLIHVRRIGDAVSEESIQGLIALAEVEIKEGNLLGAVGYLDKIQGEPKKLLIDLIKDIKSRIIADESIKDFSDYIILRIQ